MLATTAGPVSDEQYLERAKAGDEEAFEGLLRRYLRMIRGRARSFFLQGAEYEDLIQEGMLGLFKAVRDYRPGSSSFHAFADLCVTRQIITAVKTASRQKHEPLNFARSLDAPKSEESGSRTFAESLHDPKAVFEAALLQTDEFRRILKLLKNHLSDFEYGALSLWLQGRSFQEIANRLGKHAKAVDNGMWRAKCKIRRLLGAGIIQ